MGRRLNPNSPYAKQLKQAEINIIRYALEMAGSLRKAAVLLGVSPNFLSERIRILGIPTEFRKSPGLPERRRQAIENQRKPGRPRKNPAPEEPEEDEDDELLDDDELETDEVDDDDDEVENEDEDEAEDDDDEEDDEEPEDEEEPEEHGDGGPA